VREAATALAASRLFAALPSPILAEVGRLMRPVAFDAGETVFRQGQPGDHLILIESGLFEAALSTPGGRELPLSVIAPGEVVGELSLLGDGRRTSSVRAVEHSQGWLLDRRSFEFLRVSGATAGIAAVAERIGRLAVERLDALYRRTAAGLTPKPRTCRASASSSTSSPRTSRRSLPVFLVSRLRAVSFWCPWASRRRRCGSCFGGPWRRWFAARPQLAGCAWPVRGARSGIVASSARVPSPLRSRAEPASAPS
jgi:CRP-like cAMP-binding protein